MTDVEKDLPARLTTLADTLAADGHVSTDDVIATYRHRRRARAGLLASVAAVVVIAVGVPVTLGSLSSAPAGPAAPAPTTGAPTVIGRDDARIVPEGEAEAERSAAEESRRAAEDAERAAEEAEAGLATAAAAAASAEAAPELAAGVAAVGGPVVLSSPREWDRWLPDGKPYPGASTEEDMATCPELSARLGAELGMQFSYWTGTLPAGPSGCTWVPVPLSYDGPYDYAYLFDVGFVGDGTTVDQLRTVLVMGGGQTEYPGDTPCPSADVPGGAALIRCAGMDGRYDAAWSLAVPDARGAGVWLLSASAQSSTGRSSAEALTVLTEVVGEVYG